MTSERRSRKNPAVEPDPAVLNHVRSLGLASVEDYVAWCVRHGFSRRTDKTLPQRVKERSFATRTAAEACLARKKSEVRNPEKTIQAILAGQLGEDQVTQPHLRALCRAARSLKFSDLRRAFLDLLLHVTCCADLLGVHPVIPSLGRQEGNTFLGGLLELARHSEHWIRPPAEWKPRTHNSVRQFASLARHLFARWPLPAFLDSVWFRGNGSEADRQQRWFLHLGAGQNIRTADLPLPYTKRMAHHFLEAPPDFTVEQALRWGQIHGLGGDARLVRAVIGTNLGSNFEHDDFWVTVLQFLIAHPLLDRAQVGPIIDYVSHQRFVPEGVERAPAQPGFTMKGRSPTTLLRQVEEWHRSLARVRQPEGDWPASGIQAFEFVEGSAAGGNRKVWTLTELVSTKALAAEGQAMNHCVATYARSCTRGVCSIWALELTTAEGRSKQLTVEVRNEARLICQARGKRNVLATDRQRGILGRWAVQAGLKLAGLV